MDVTDQEQEVAQLKDSCEGQVKVIKGIGDFTHVVTITPKDTGLQVKFQLTASYPSSAAVISIRSTSLTPEQVDTLTSLLQTEANSLGGNPAIHTVIQTCEKWVTDNDIDVTETTIDSLAKKEKGKRKQKGKRSSDKPSQVEPEDQFVKKPPMKTASSVIKRIQWDEAVDKDAFIVGYLDRLTGLEERAFSDFDWEDLATVDQYALAIPQHRIQYFKYKDEKVWDKNERLDNVFGSTGNNITIVEAIDAYEAKHRNTGTCEENGDNVDREADELRPDTHIVDGNDKDGSENDGSGDLNEAVASLHINTNTADNETQAKPSVGATSGYTSSKHKRDHNSNFFLALRITDEECINNFQAIQKVLSRQFPQYKDYAIPKNGFHVTLSLLHLETDADVARCIAALKDIRPRIVEMCKLAEPLVFQGFGFFSSKVIYADVKHSPRLNLLVDTIETHLVHANVRVVPEGRYIPHMTLFNVSRSRTREADWPRKLPELAPLAETRIGTQAVDHVCLCQMGTLTEASDFYTSPLTIVVSDDE